MSRVLQIGLFGLLCLGIETGSGHCADERSLLTIADEQFEFAAQQYESMLDTLGDEKRFPYSYVDGKLNAMGPGWWTSGFFPGSLWLLYEQNGDETFRKAAEAYTHRLESQQDNARNHDIGFKLFCSYGNGYRLTQDPAYRNVLIAGARALGKRFDPKVGAIRSWDRGPWKYPVIIDNMMNLELLLFAHQETREALFANIAVHHADRTAKDHYRLDSSSYHVVSYEPETGNVDTKQTHQGYSDESAWARGQVLRPAPVHPRT